MSVVFSLARAGRWLLDSGIQEASGGVARFYRAEIGKNKPVSTEISGYCASAFIYLFEVTGDEEYLDRARKTAQFLLERAWDSDLRTFPFEYPSPSPKSSHHAYFFDCGIILRGLVAVWRHSKEDQRLLDVAAVAARRVITDFHGGGDYHPILELPAKKALPRSARWSRNSGCYQLKAALSWWELAEITGDPELRNAYLEMVDTALATHSSYLPGSENPHEVMDRLHPYSYFLEGLTPVLHRLECQEAFCEGILTISRYRNEISDSFSRSDVNAQLLRARLVLPEVDMRAAAEEARTLAAFQASSEDPRIDGGFLFGRRDGSLSPHVNPVSTVFALQALEMYRERMEGSSPRCSQLI